MAERLLRAGLEQRLGPAAAEAVQVGSAGTHALPGDDMQPGASEALDELGLDADGFGARLLAAADAALAQHPEWGRAGVRFDVLLVDAAGQVRRVADAFRLEG